MLGRLAGARGADRLDGRDFGIDLVAVQSSGDRVAIQCKCYAETAFAGRLGQLSTFLANSQHNVFPLRWIVATLNRGRPRRRRESGGFRPPCGRSISAGISTSRCSRKPPRGRLRQPWPLQEDASIRDVVRGLENHDRGRLVMACGTGTDLHRAQDRFEQVVPDGGRILFLAPSIALVSQARREWLIPPPAPFHCCVFGPDGRRARRERGHRPLRAGMPGHDRAGGDRVRC